VNYQEEKLFAEYLPVFPWRFSLSNILRAIGHVYGLLELSLHFSMIMLTKVPEFLKNFARLIRENREVIYMREYH